MALAEDAEILAHREDPVSGRTLFYVHFVDCKDSPVPKLEKELMEVDFELTGAWTSG